MDMYEKMLKFGFVDMSSGPAPSGSFIVKVQRPPVVSPNMPDHFLVYNEDRSVKFMASPKGLEKLDDALAGRKTAYFWAEWQSKGNIHINTQKPVDDLLDW
jgi:hypothetical protein